MALLVKGQVKQVIGSGAFTLQADPGESFLVRSIRVAAPTTSYLTVMIDQFKAGYWRVAGALGNHLPFVLGNAKHSHNIVTGAGTVGDQTSFADLTNAGGTTIGTKVLGGIAASTTLYKAMEHLATQWPGGMSLMQWMMAQGLFMGYPIETGQRMTITGVQASGCILEVEYDIYSEGDIKRTMPNGSESSILEYISYGNTGASINATGSTLYDTMVNPQDFPRFPWEDDVPANHRIEVHGVLGSPFAPKENDGTNYTNETYLKLIREQTTLFDEDLNGFLFYDATATVRGAVDRVGEGYSKIGNYSDRDNNPPLRFDPPLIFAANEDLDLYLTTVKTASGQDITTEEHEIGLILRKVRL